MLTDRKRTEAIFFPLTMMNIVESGARDKSEEDFKVIRQYFIDACDEVMRGCDERKMVYIMRRAVKLHGRVMKDFIKGDTRTDKVGIVVMMILQAALESDYLVLDEGSKMSIAADAIIAGLQDAMEQDRLLASAKKQAVKTLRALQSEGYFEGASLTED